MGNVIQEAEPRDQGMWGPAERKESKVSYTGHWDEQWSHPEETKG